MVCHLVIILNYSVPLSINFMMCHLVIILNYGMPSVSTLNYGVALSNRINYGVPFSNHTIIYGVLCSNDIKLWCDILYIMLNFGVPFGNHNTFWCAFQQSY